MGGKGSRSNSQTATVSSSSPSCSTSARHTSGPAAALATRHCSGVSLTTICRAARRSALSMRTKSASRGRRRASVVNGSRSCSRMTSLRRSSVTRAVLSFRARRCGARKLQRYTPSDRVLMRCAGCANSISPARAGRPSDGRWMGAHRHGATIPWWMESPPDQSRGVVLSASANSPATISNSTRRIARQVAQKLTPVYLARQGRLTIDVYTMSWLRTIRRQSCASLRMLFSSHIMVCPSGGARKFGRSGGWKAPRGRRRRCSRSLSMGLDGGCDVGLAYSRFSQLHQR
jgi:hypothetical protein